MAKKVIVLLLFLAAVAGIFFWIVNAAEEKGSLSTELKHAQNEIVKKDLQHEEERKQAQRREKIYVSPNKQRAAVLKLMHDGMY